MDPLFEVRTGFRTQPDAKWRLINVIPSWRLAGTVIVLDVSNCKDILLCSLSVYFGPYCTFKLAKTIKLKCFSWSILFRMLFFFVCNNSNKNRD